MSKCFRVYIEDYRDESSAFVLADTDQDAEKRATPDLDPSDDQVLVIERVPELDGLWLTDFNLWKHGIIQSGECQGCGRMVSYTEGETFFDDDGWLHCSRSCARDPRYQQITTPDTHRTYAIVGTEY